MATKYVQALTQYLAGSGAIIGATSITLTSLTDIYGTAITAITSFGTKGYITFEPDTTNEEAATFTGVTVNANGTVTLTGVATVIAQSPYTETSGLVRQHSGGTKVVITDNVAFWNTFANKANDEVITGRWSTTTVPLNNNDLATKSYADGLAIAGSPDSSTSVKGITKMSTAPASPTSPIAVGDNDTRVPTQGENDALVGLSGNAVGTANPLTDSRAFSGMVSPYAGYTAPTGWLMCDGSAVSRATYVNLFNLISPSLGTVTISIATPGEVTLNAHGLATGDSIYLTTTGALPTGLSINTRYWVIKKDANTFYGATSLANALAGTKITTSGSQSGTQTLYRNSYGVGDGTTTFNLPNLKGLIPTGVDQSQTEFAGIGQTGGEKTHQLTIPELAAHTHTIPQQTAGGGGSLGIGAVASSTSSPTTGSTGSDTAHNNIQPYLTLNYIIKY